MFDTPSFRYAVIAALVLVGACQAEIPQATNTFDFTRMFSANHVATWDAVLRAAQQSNGFIRVTDEESGFVSFITGTASGGSDGTISNIGSSPIKLYYNVLLETANNFSETSVFVVTLDRASKRYSTYDRRFLDAVQQNLR
jgi:hypothetical protein